MATKQIKESATPALKSNGQLMALGDFVFEISSMAYQQLDRQNSWRHPGTDPVGAHPNYQFTGPGAETINISGIIYKEFSNPQALDTVREMADAGESYVLVSASGKVLGFYVIDDVTENQSFFNPDGEALRIEFSIKLTRARLAESEDA